MFGNDEKDIDAAIEKVSVVLVSEQALMQDAGIYKTKSHKCLVIDLYCEYMYWLEMSLKIHIT